MVAAAALESLAPYRPFFTRPLEAVASDLESYAQLLAKWQPAQNLVSRETLSAFWTRHAADSLQVLRWLQPDDRRFADIGSGGGFPALPLAIALRDSPAAFLLIEPNGRKASFLRTVARELDLAVQVEARRAGENDSRETSVDVVTARAVAALPLLLELAQPLFGPQTRGLFHKGREYGEELVESAALWHHDVIPHQSDTDADAVVLEISNLRLRNT